MKALIGLCMIFSFIFGAFTTVLVEKNRALNKQCQVKFSRDAVTHVHVGEWQ
jgi:hypothetical protein